VTAQLGPDGGARIEAPEEASSVYAKGFFGALHANGTLALDAYEAVYLAEMDRIVLHGPRDAPVGWPIAFRRAVKLHPEFAVRYLVYRDLRQRGYVVRRGPPPVVFAVLPRGGTLHKTPSKFWVEALSEREPFDLGHLRELSDRALAARKTLWLGVVDEESDLTYYRVRQPEPSGALVPAPLTEPAEAWLSEDRVTVLDPTAVEGLGRQLSYGSRVGHRLELSLLEATHLARAGQLRVRESRSGRAVPLEALVRRARRLDPKFAERIAAYEELRRRRLVVKTGFKYGAHFRAYPRNPEHAHARYLVHALPEDHVATWPEVAGSVRVAQGVRKEYLLGSVGPTGVRFLSLERIRP
jgi:tRNA-intron endonuclease